MQARGPYGPRGFESLSRRQMASYYSREIGKWTERRNEANQDHTSCSGNHSTLRSFSSQSSTLAKHRPVLVHYQRQASILSWLRTNSGSTILPLGEGTCRQQDTIYRSELHTHIWGTHPSRRDVRVSGQRSVGHIPHQPLHLINNR